MGDGVFFNYQRQSFDTLQRKLINDIIRNSQQDSDPRLSKKELLAYHQQLNERLAKLESKGLNDQYLESLFSTASTLNEQYDIVANAIGADFFSEEDILNLASRDLSPFWNADYLSEDDLMVDLIERSLPEGFNDLPFSRKDNLITPRREKKDGSNSDKIYAPEYTIKEALPYQQFIANKLGNQDGEITQDELGIALHRSFESPLFRDLYSVDSIRTTTKTSESTKWHDIRAKAKNLFSRTTRDLQNLFELSGKKSLSSQWLKSVDDEIHSVTSDTSYYNYDESLYIPREVSGRAVFNIEAKSGNLDFNILGKSLDRGLLHRQGVSSPEEIVALDQKVLNLTAKLDIKRTPYTVDALLENISKYVPGYDLRLRDVDFSTKIIAASKLLAIFKNRPDLLNKMLESGHGGSFDFLLANAAPRDSDDGFRRGYVSSEDNHFSGFYHTYDSHFSFPHGITLATEALYGGFHIIHEAMHALDHVGNGDGYLPDMTQHQKNIITQEKERLAGLKASKSSSYHAGFDYALTNKSEFIADTIEIFIGNPKFLNTHTPALYTVYKDYFQIDPLNYPENQDGGLNNHIV